MTRHEATVCLRHLIFGVLGILSLSVAARAQTVFSENFEGDLSSWVGRNGGTHHGVLVDDPIRSHNQVLSFTELNEAGDIFGPEMSVSPGHLYILHFEYLGLPGPGSILENLGGVIGFSEDTPGAHRWLAGTVLCCYIDDDLLIDDGTWHSYSLTIDPYLPGSVYDGLPSNNTIRVMIEDFLHSGGVPGDAYFDNVTVTVAPGPPTVVRFCEDFEGGLNDWVGKNEGVHHGLIVADPVRAGKSEIFEVEDVEMARTHAHFRAEDVAGLV